VESGRSELYVKSFVPSPDAGSSASAGKWMVSRNAGTPMANSWRKDGRELYYLAPDGNVMAVEIAANPAFRAGAPKALFTAPSSIFRISVPLGTLAAASPDGQRFLFAVPADLNTREELTVMVNWSEKLKR
jgi:hypothetical protein